MSFRAAPFHGRPFFSLTSCRTSRHRLSFSFSPLFVPTLENLKKEGESGRKQINQYTRYLTVLIATVQSTLTAQGLNSSALEPGWFFQLTTVISLVGGTMFLVWLGEQITARGIGNGSSLIIFAGIVAEMPTALYRILEQGRSGVLSPAVILGPVCDDDRGRDGCCLL